ncbi:MAG: T9SS type A sorting domain-containing protein [Flavobacteriales bacterium]
MKNLLPLIGLGLLLSTSLISQNLCTDTSNFFTFQFNNSDYTIVKDGKSWSDAMACANQLGGVLAQIDSQEEQDAIWYEIQNANIINSNTVAPDGGQGSYIWLGGTDAGVEGDWVWIDLDGNTTQFWQGTADGNPVSGLYNNWGNEPDDYLGQQDGLALGLTSWPLGAAGEWNDVNVENLLYFIVESDIDTSSSGGGGNNDTTSIVENNNQLIENVVLYPNPASNYFFIQSIDIVKVEIINTLGQIVFKQKFLPQNKIDVSGFSEGLFIVKIFTKNDKILTQNLKIIR